MRLGHHADDAGQQRVFADTGSSAAQHAFAVGRRREDAIAGTLGHRQALAGQHRLIDARRPLDHLAINRQALTGADDEDITGNQQRRVEFDELAVAFDARRLGLQAHQRLDRRRCARLGTGFKQLAEQHQRDHRRRGLEVDRQLMNTTERHDQAKEVRRAGPQGHQHIHVGASAAQRLPAAVVETPTDPELHWRRQHELQPARQQVLMSMPGQVQSIEHGRHLRHQRQRQDSRNPEAVQFSTVQGFLACLFLFPRTVVRYTTLEAGALDRRDHLRGVGHSRHVTHSRPLGREIDRRFDARQAVQHFLDTRRAGRAGHPLDTDIERLRRNTEASLLDRGNHLRRHRFTGRKIDPRPLGRQIHTRLDTGQAVQHFLDARRAGRAGHAADRQIKAAGRIRGIRIVTHGFPSNHHAQSRPGTARAHRKHQRPCNHPYDAPGQEFVQPRRQKSSQQQRRQGAQPESQHQTRASP